MGDVHGFPGDHEAYVTRAELAELMAVDPKTITRWRKQGLPYEDWGMRSHRFQPSRAIAWARARGH